MQHLLAIGLLSATLALSGCFKQMANDAVEGATSAENSARIAALLGSDELKTSVQGLGRAVVLGTLEGLSDEEMNAKIQASVGQFVDSLVPVLTTALEQDLSPSVQAELRKNIDVAVQALLAGQNRRKAEAWAAGITQATMNTLRENLGGTVAYEIGPALQIVLETNIGPGVNAVLVNDVGPGIEDMLTFNLLPPVTVALDSQRAALVKDLDRVLNKGQETIQTVAQIVTAISVLLLILLLIAGYFLFKIRGENQVRERTVKLLARQIRLHAEDPATQSLIRSIRSAGQSSEEGRYLSDLLRRNEALKVQLPAE